MSEGEEWSDSEKKCSTSEASQERNEAGLYTLRQPQRSMISHSLVRC